MPLAAGKASPEKCSSGSSDGSVENVAVAKADVEDESGDDEFQDEIHFDPTISSGHLGFRDVRLAIVSQSLLAFLSLGSN